MLTVQGHNFEVDYWAFGVFLYEMAIGCASFNVEADGTMNHEMPPFKVCQNILNANYTLRFDIGIYKISPELQDVIKQLLERRVEHRIGCRNGGSLELCNHPFFAPIDFEKLRAFEYQPPWNPELQVRATTRARVFAPRRCARARAVRTPPSTPRAHPPPARSLAALAGRAAAFQNGLDTRYFEATHKMRKSELIAFGIQD
jgi:serine/threonine protein kinase